MASRGRTTGQSQPGEVARRFQRDLDRLGEAVPLARSMGDLIDRMLGTAQPPTPQMSVVRGRVLLPSGTGAPRLVVRALHRSLRAETLLGEAVSGARGEYQISYQADPSLPGGARGVQLVVRVLNPLGVLLASSATIHAAPSPATVDVALADADSATFSQYEQILQALGPQVADLPLASLTDDQVALLASSSGLDVAPVRRLATATRLAEATELLSPAVFFGLLSLGEPDELDRLLAKAPDALIASLQAAISRQLVPARLRDNLETIGRRLDQLRVERGATVLRIVQGRLLVAEGDRPLAAFEIAVLDPPSGGEPAPLDTVLTDRAGEFAFSYPEPSGQAPGRRFELRIRTPRGDEAGRVAVQVGPPDVPLVVRIPDPAAPPTLPELNRDLGLGLPDNVVANLEERGIRTLDDLRRAGGLVGLPEPGTATRKLEAMAALSSLGGSAVAGAGLIDAGFESPADIARAARVEVVTRAATTLGDLGAAQHQAQARAIQLLALNAVTEARLSLDDRVLQVPVTEGDDGPPDSDPLPPDELADLFPASCDCAECTSAAGPLAYLADLLDYVAGNLQSVPDDAETGPAVSIEMLADRFHQPFGQIPASCEQTERLVRRARLGIEALRRFLTAASRPAAGSIGAERLAASQRRYLEEGYTRLLTGLGTSPQELRRALAGEAPGPVALAERLGLDPAEPDQLAALALDAASLTEASLERLFGLADTTSDPATVPPAPELLDRQLAQLGAVWRAQDETAGRPVVDPDLIGPGYLKTPVAGDPAFDLWQDRRDDVDGRAATLRSDRASAADDPTWLDASFQEKLNQPTAGLLALDERRAAGEDIRPDLDALHLSMAAFARLLQLARLAALGQLLERDADDVIDILIQVDKSRLVETWRQQEREQVIALGPDHFVIPRTTSTLSRAAAPLRPGWRATEADLRTWRSTLRLRIEQRQAVVAALDAAVDAAEEASLPLLRQALIEATGVPVEALTDQLLIDLEADACQQTTRVAQAIEIVQDILWSVRTRQLNDTHPDLELVDDDFDTAWQWLGSYETWRAAMLVFLYPENIVQPGLRRHQTTAFASLIQQTRAARGITPDTARRLAGEYAAYLRDVASLQLGATCFAVARLGPPSRLEAATGLRRLFFVFARAEASRTVYWSVYDPSDSSGYAQSLWRPVPGLAKVKSIVGAALYQPIGEQGYIYLFVTVEQGGGQRLALTRLDLESGLAGWDEQPAVIPVKDDAVAFTVVLTQAKETTRPPELVLQLTLPSGRHQIVYGRLEVSVAGAAVATWLTVDPDTFEELLASVAWGADDHLIFTRLADQLRARTRGVIRTVTYALAGWQGAFCWPGHENLVYAFWRDANGLRYSVIWGDPQPVHEPRTFGTPFPSSLALVAPHSSLRFFETTEQTLAYQLGGSDPRIFISRLTRLPAIGLPFAARAANGPSTGTHLTVLAMRRDNGHFGPIGADGVFDPGQPPDLPPPPPPPVDPPAPALLRLEERERRLAAPRLRTLLEIDAPLSEHRLRLRRTSMVASFTDNLPGPPTNLVYVEEAYYFVPVLLALQLQQSDQFIAALDWLRTVFDYSRRPGQRKIFTGLRREESLAAVYERSEDWLLDPLDPHSIASTRRNAYTRFTVLTLAACFVDYADRELTRDTAESVERARILYDTALELLRPSEGTSDCAAMIRDLDGQIGPEIGNAAPEWRPVWERARDLLARIGDRAALQQVRSGIEAAWLTSDPLPARVAKLYGLVAAAGDATPDTLRLGEVVARKNETVARAQARLQRVPSYAAAETRLVGVVGRDLRAAVAKAVDLEPEQLERDPRIELPWLHRRLDRRDDASSPGGGPLPPAQPEELSPLRLARTAQVFGPAYAPAPVYQFCVPSNPRVDALRQRAELNLAKIRMCRDITGEPRELPVYGATADRQDDLPAVLDGQLVPAATRASRPTPYRYAALIERARQLVNYAQQAEAAFLASLEKRDAETFSLLRARQDIQLTRAGVRLQDLRLREAEDGIDMAGLQQTRARLHADYYQGLVDESDISLGTLLAAGAAAAAAAASAGTVPTGILAAAGSLFSSWSSNQQRQEEYERQLRLAQKDVEIAGQQIALASDRLRVVGQERAIGILQADHAAATADFLAHKFTNADLYDWMSGVLEATYSFFLQQATATARLAASQLAFERQTVLPPFIQAGYWESTESVPLGSGADAQEPDRRGLTGSARLLQDIFQLDQFAFSTDRRRLQLTRTISLSQLAPAEFQRFRESGVMRFDTTLEMFDRDFPGHYLRLIRRVRCTVVALIPTVGGISATLANGGLSRVVVPRADGFQTIQVNRPAESVALSSPRDASGTFELAPQPQDLLLPFEGLGVETAWELQLPRAANRFDFGTIADVLIVVEYTALSSLEYRAQVIEGLNRRLSADRPFSFRQELADQWYDLNNPEQLDLADQMVARFTTRREDFPPNLENLRIQEVTVFFARSATPGSTDPPTLEVPITSLTFTEQGQPTSVGGAATTVGGLASTQLGNAPSWLPMRLKQPFGTWELVLRDNLTDGRAPLKALRSGEIPDILLIITYVAEVSAWPI